MLVLEDAMTLVASQMSRLHPVQVRMQQRLERVPITLDDRGMRD